METDQNGDTRSFVGQVLAEIRDAAQQQSQLFLRALENRDATRTPGEKRSNVPWPTFLGEPDENVRSWLQSMEYAFKAHKIADEDKVVNAALCLKGEASEWLMGLTRKRGEEPFANWSDFESGIKKRFEPANLQTRLQLQLHEIKQTATLEEYIRRFQNLVMQVDDLPELTKVTHFMCGLKTGTCAASYASKAHRPSKRPSASR